MNNLYGDCVSFLGAFIMTERHFDDISSILLIDDSSYTVLANDNSYTALIGGV